MNPTTIEINFDFLKTIYFLQQISKKNLLYHNISLSLSVLLSKRHPKCIVVAKKKRKVFFETYLEFGQCARLHCEGVMMT